MVLMRMLVAQRVDREGDARRDGSVRDDPVRTHRSNHRDAEKQGSPEGGRGCLGKQERGGGGGADIRMHMHDHETKDAVCARVRTSTCPSL